MTLHDQLVRIFVVYLFVKALIFLPLTWVAICLWWNERKAAKELLITEPVVNVEKTSYWYDHLLGLDEEVARPPLADVLS